MAISPSKIPALIILSPFIFNPNFCLLWVNNGRLSKYDSVFSIASVGSPALIVPRIGVMLGLCKMVTARAFACRLIYFFRSRISKYVLTVPSELKLNVFAISL